MDIDSFTQRYRKKAKNILSVLDAENSGGGNFDLTEAKKFLEFAAEPQIQIAVIGAVKAGKSSLLNALFGNEITSADVIPETACLSVFKYSQTNNFKATFYSQGEWDKLWESQSDETDFSKKYDKLNAGREKGKYVGRAPVERSFCDLDQLKKELEGYTSAKYPVHFFVKKLEIGLSDYPVDKGLYFVDTPGLNDPVAYRSIITKDYMYRSNAIVLCINSGAMQEADLLAVIGGCEALHDDTEKLLVVGTQIDEFDKEDDWERQKAVWKERFEDSNKNVQHIVGVSAKIHLICKKINDNKDFTKRDLSKALHAVEGFMDWYDDFVDKEMVKQKAGEIYEKANIDNILRILKSGPLQDPVQMLQNDLQQRYDRLCADYLHVIEQKEHDLGETLKALQGTAQQREALVKELNQKRQALREGNEEMQKDLKSSQAEIQKMCEESKDALASAFQEQIHKATISN